ncbi:MAG: hypothetical protein ACT4P4_21405 [Betaproteobacteria bacterium]
MHRLVRGDAGFIQRVADVVRGGEECFEAQPGEGLARGETLGGLGEERSEVQALRETENSGGWRSD